MAAFDETLFEASLCTESDEWTPSNLSHLPPCKGVMLLADACGKPFQLLQAANLRRTAQAKLLRQETSLRRKADVSELTTTIFYTCCQTTFELTLTYLRLAHAVFGSGAADWIRLPKLTLAAIETDAWLPFFDVSDNPQRREHRRVFGLFPNRKSAAEFCDTLNTVFILCRNPALLQTGKESTCPYLQMETCPGPCLDLDLRAGYQQSVEQACEAAAGKLDPVLERLAEQMNQAAQSMRFERAAALKKQSRRLRQLTGPDFQWVHDLRELRIIHIDRGPKRKISGRQKKQQLYRTWKITDKSIYQLGDFVPLRPEQVMSFLQRSWDRGNPMDFTSDSKEHLSVLTFFLFRSNRPGLWLDCTGSIPEEVLTQYLFDERGPRSVTAANNEANQNGGNK